MRLAGRTARAQGGTLRLCFHLVHRWLDLDGIDLEFQVRPSDCATGPAGGPAGAPDGLHLGRSRQRAGLGARLLKEPGAGMASSILAAPSSLAHCPLQFISTFSPAGVLSTHYPG